MANLNRVLIHNFRNVANKEITLLGSNIISGPNMIGKTNTLNAIHWAFTGVDMTGANDNRANFTIGGDDKISVLLDFGSFTFERVCVMANDSPTIKTYIDGEEAKSVKTGEALLCAKLGLADFVLTQPKGFNIVRFLLDPLYFDTISPSALRKFLYKQASIDFRSIADQQSGPTKALLEKRGIYEPYKLSDDISKDKKDNKTILEAVKLTAGLYPQTPEFLDETKKITNNYEKQIKMLETEEALADKYALAVSKRVDKYYEKAMGIQVCLLEKGVGDGVYKDVCYPILPKSKLPFSVGSQAEKTYVGMKFINEVCLTWNIKPLIVLIDNMESLDEKTKTYVDDLGVQYIGAMVK